ncbi:MAG: outer membrane lipoprotein-sorting protein [Spirochaetes bacterium]|nr:outer membrane lipoprotein-sorting protein [Spirochaetota bacterium]
MKSFNLFIAAAVLITAARTFNPYPAAGESNAGMIIKKADAPFITEKMYSVGTLTIYRSGNPRPGMEIETYSLNRGNNYYSLIIYRKPARLKGTAYLLINDDLWVRFASTGRVRKLSSSARENSAGGSDFSYNDMGESGKGMASQYNAELKSSSVSVNGRKCYKITLKPKAGRKSHYSKITAFIDRENFHYLKIDYYKNNANIKSLLFSDYRAVNGRDYPFKMVMESHIRPTKTEIITGKIDLNSPKVKDSIFTVSYLKRIR